MPLRHVAPALRKGVVASVLVALVCSANHFCRDAPGTIEEQLAAGAYTRPLFSST
jgi:hypothetical protein